MEMMTLELTAPTLRDNKDGDDEDEDDDDDSSDDAYSKKWVHTL